MSFNLGSFAGGLFQGASSVASIYSAYQGIQANQMQLDAAKQWQDLQKTNEWNAGYTDGQPNNPNWDPTTNQPRVQQETIYQNGQPVSGVSQPATSTASGGGAERIPVYQVSLPPPQSVQPQSVQTTMPTPLPSNFETPNTVAGSTVSPMPAAPAAAAPNPNYASQTLTREQRTGLAPLPVVRPDAASNFSGTPAQTTAPMPPSTYASPTQMQTYDVPPQPASQQPPTPAVAAPPTIMPSPGEGTTQGLAVLPAPSAPPTATTPAAAPAPAQSLLQRPSAITNAPVGSTITSPFSRAPTPAAPTPAATTPAPGPGAQTQQPGMVSRALSAINPIGSAQAAEAPPAQAAPAEKPEAISTPKAAPAETKQEPGPVATVAKVAPGQTQPSEQSEKTSFPLAPQVDPRPWRELQDRDPQIARLVQDTVDKYGGGMVSVQQVAAHMKGESNFNRAVPDSKDGAQGMMQVLPSTAQDLHIRGDLHDPATNVAAAVIYLRKLSEQFGAGTVQTNYAYKRGDGGALRAAADLTKEIRSQPEGWRSLQAMYPQKVDDQRYFTGGSNRGSNWNPPDIINAGNQGGPEGLLNVIATTGPAGLPMSQRWRSAQAAVETAMIAHGNYNALPMIQNWFAQQSHQGALSNLMVAHQMLSVGNGQAAAQALAKAHAFFPDGSYGQFGVDAKGNVYAQQISENTGEKLGQPMLITKQAVEQQMLGMQNPANYLDALMKYRAANANIEYKQAETEYLKEKPDLQFALAGLKAENQAALAEERQKNAAAQKALSDEYSREKEIKGDADRYYGPNSMAYQNAASDEDRRLLGRTSDVFTALRYGTAMSPNNADYLARKIASGAATLKPGKNDKGEAAYGVVEGKETIGYLPGKVGDEILKMAGSGAIKRGSGQQAMGIGGGTGSQVALLQGMNQNLAGIPSAALTQPFQPGSAMVA